LTDVIQKDGSFKEIPINVPFYIARRYLSSRRKKNVINWITRISVVGIAAITAALIILLSAFNGIEKMIEELYSEYDTDITIRSAETKTFNDQRIDFKKLKAISGVQAYTRAVEEVVILKHEKKWVNTKLVGVEDEFLSITNMDKHMVERGRPILHEDTTDYGIIGATLLDKLGGYLPERVGYESVVCYVPKRKIKVGFGQSPFKTKTILISAKMSYNREVNAENFIIPLDLAQELMGYENHISAVYVDVKEGYGNEEVKAAIIKALGAEYIVKTNFEKNELIYKTSRSEKLIVLFILVFIFILAAFNLVSSLTMLFVEKIANIKTMQSFGANKRFIFKIFFLEGLLISGKGIFFGTAIGYLICFLQLQFGLLTMPNSGGEAFPISFSMMDGIIILSLVSMLSVLFSYFPVKYLIYKNVNA
jgi:lipoprotein-releasing system permease protein